MPDQVKGLGWFLSFPCDFWFLVSPWHPWRRNQWSCFHGRAQVPSRTPCRRLVTEVIGKMEPASPCLKCFHLAFDFLKLKTFFTSILSKPFTNHKECIRKCYRFSLMKNSILIWDSDPPSYLLGSHRLYGFMNERINLNLGPLDCFQNLGSYVAVPVGIKNKARDSSPYEIK